MFITGVIEGFVEAWFDPTQVTTFLFLPDWKINAEVRTIQALKMPFTRSRQQWRCKIPPQKGWLICLLPIT
jgi:hypothetical protein